MISMYEREYLLLSEAIIEQAARDYVRNAIKVERGDLSYTAEKYGVERFFRSGWCRTLMDGIGLTDLDVDTFIHLLDKRVAANKPIAAFSLYVKKPTTYNHIDTWS